ncbi:hypothetical protein SH580_18195 [Coraliomargarita algicola]|uniref:Uncharacterized protein n=1 Tax=Coraliomargarita algicola TaxID=3092156 RepID=A0ABZ0RGQ4_9BACT|nr:hypothetical protein [Coraliomargarita sp. J2-16]WPJ95355.1 hypothetical protein SH580_18195 [Coraliomargarita sp. J2-16]
MSKTLSLLLGLLLSLSIHLHAQKADDTPQLKLDFQIYIWPHGGATLDQNASLAVSKEGELLPKYVGQRIGLLQGDQTILIPADKARLSKPITYSGPPPIRFIEYDSAPTGDQLPSIIAEVNPPASMTDGLFILFPESQSTVKYQILAVDTSQQKLSAGNTIIYNLTPSDIAIQVGETQMQMRAMASETVAINHLRDSKLPIQIAVESEQAGQWTLRYSTRKMIQPDSRLIFLIYNPQANKSLYRILTLNADD